MMKHYFWLGLLAVFFLIAAVLYSPSLSGPWQYDDYAQILDEKVLTGRSLPKLLSSVVKFTAHSDGWTGTRDLVRATFLLNWQWWGNEPAGYRWINLLIHVVNATLVAGVVWLLVKIPNTEYRIPNKKSNSPHSEFPARSGYAAGVAGGSIQNSVLFWLPAFAGLLFLVHPLQSQAVAYVAQRFTSMATMFYLGAIVSWLLFLRAPRKKIADYYLLVTSYLFALLAFNSKEIAITLPVALALVTLVAAPRMSNATNKPINTNKYQLSSVIGAHWVIGLLGYWKLFILLLPFFLLSLKIPAQIVSSSYGSSGNLNTLASVAIDSLALTQKAVDLTRHDYFLTQINVVGTYLRLAVLPVRQTLDYDYPLTTALDLKTGAKGFLHIMLIGLGLWLLLKPRRQMTNDELRMTNEKSRSIHSTFNIQHSTFSFRLIGFGILWFYLTLLPESSVIPIADLIYEHRMYLPMVGLVIAAAAIAAAFHETHKTHKTNVSHLVVAAAFMLILAAATMRRAYIWGNEVRLWADIYEKAPNKPRANKNYGVVLAAAGKYEEGVKRLARAVELEPDNADYWSNFGTAYLRWGKYEDSAGKFLKAYDLFIAQHPDLEWEVYETSHLKDRKQAAQYMNDYGVSMVQLQRGDEALAGFEKALKIDPTLYAAWLGLGASYNIKGDTEMAIKIFSQTVKDFPDQPDGYNNLSIMLKRAGRVEEAAAVLARMPKAAPKSP